MNGGQPNGRSVPLPGSVGGHPVAAPGGSPRVCWGATADSLHQQLADELWEADRTAKPIAPLTERYPDLVIEDAYAIQTINIDRRVAAGQKVIGRKVGLTCSADADSCSAWTSPTSAC